MSETTTGSDQLGRVVRWIDMRLRRLGERIFERSDAVARQHGWQITVRQHGLARSYRDPRFDLLVGCPDCRGSGRDTGPAGECGACRGNGRIVRVPGPPRAGGV